MNSFFKGAACGLALLIHQSLPAFAEDVTLNAIFMKQAAYSEDDTKAMAKAFEGANPGLKVNLEFVPYEALHDKIVAAQGAGGRLAAVHHLASAAGAGTVQGRS